MQKQYPLDENDKVLQLASFSFDFSVWEIFGTLSAGARLILVEPGGHRDPAYIARLIAEREVTVAHFVPSMLAVFLQEPDVDRCTSLRMVFSGGEALSVEVQRRFFEKFYAELHNQYGPTETSIDVTYWECKPFGEARAVPIGRPNANNRVYVLDGMMKPVGVGIRGELYIGGVAVGRGYIGRQS